MKHTTSPKYVLARELLRRLPGLFLPDYRAATLYAKLEQHGYVWNGRAWVKRSDSEQA